MTVCRGQGMPGHHRVIATLLLPQGKTKDKKIKCLSSSKSTKEFKNEFYYLLGG